MRISVLCFLSCALMLTASVAKAEVISVDLNTGGDGLLTRDLTNGLDWLDLLETKQGGNNRSYNDVASQLGSGGEFEGFRHATRIELIALWASAGIHDIDVGGTVANLVPMLDLMELMGNTAFNPSVQQIIWGIIADSNSAGTHASATLEELGTTARARSDHLDAIDTNTDISGGHYLVRDSLIAVPEPSVRSLLAVTLLGLLSFVGLRRTGWFCSA